MPRSAAATRAAMDRFRVLSLREISAHRGRLIASTAVVLVSTALLVTVLSIITSIDAAIDSVGDRVVGNARVEVSAASGAGMDAALTDAVARTDGVAAAVPMVQTTVTTEGDNLLLVGSTLSASALRSPVQRMVAPELGPLLSRPGSVLVGPAVGIAPDRTIMLQGTRTPVAAVLDDEDAHRFNGGRFAFAPIDTAQRISGRGTVIDSILVVAREGTDTAALSDRVAGVVDSRALVGAPNAERLKTSNGVALIRYVALSSAGMAFLVSAFLIYTAMSMAIAGRRARISLLRALGGSRRSIAGDLVLETTLFALPGAVLGALTGLLLGRYAVGNLPAVFMQTVSARIEFTVPAAVVVGAIIVSVIVCALAAAVAARSVYKVSPLEALAPVGVSAIDRTPGWTRVAAAVVGIILAAVAFFNARTQPGILANSGITVMFAAEIAIGYALGPQLVRLAARAARLFGAAGAVAAENITRSPRRTWATLMIVAVAVAASYAISAGNANAVDSTRDSVSSLRAADIWVSTAAPGAFATGPALPDAVVRAVADAPSTAATVGEQGTYVSLGNQRAMVFGLAPGTANPLAHSVDEATARRLLTGDGIVLSRDLAEALSVEVGDRLTVPTPTGDHQITVLATVPYFSGLNGAAAIGLSQMRTWFAMPGYSAMQVTLRPGADVADSITALRQSVPAGVHVFSGDRAVDAFGEALGQATTLNHLIWIIVTLIAAVSVFNAMMLSVLDRRRELGVLRAIGASRGFLTRSVVAEAVGVALAGALAGLVFGLIQQVVADIASSRAWNVDVAFALVPLSFVLAVAALAICVAGIIPPVRQVSRMNIIEATRIE